MYINRGKEGRKEGAETMNLISQHPPLARSLDRRVTNRGFSVELLFLARSRGKKKKSELTFVIR